MTSLCIVSMSAGCFHLVLCFFIFTSSRLQSHLLLDVTGSPHLICKIMHSTRNICYMVILYDQHILIFPRTDTLKRHIPFSGSEGLQELNRIAVRFEEKIYAAATSQV